MRPVDLARIAICLAAVPAIGFRLKRFAVTGEDFFTTGRGMTGNVGAFTTEWTCDIHRPLTVKAFGDRYYVTMGRWCRLLGVFVSIGTAHLVMYFSIIIVCVQVLATFFIVPLFGAVALGMLRRRAASAGGFWGWMAGTGSSIALFLWVKIEPAALRCVGLTPLPSEGHFARWRRPVFRAGVCAVAPIAVIVVFW